MIIDRIRKLLALARDKGASEAEAATAMEMASKLMLQHNIKESEVDEKKEEPGLFPGVYPSADEWEYNLAAAAAKIYSCKEFEASVRGQKVIGFVGLKENCEAALETLKWLVEQGEAQYKQSLPKGLSKSERAEFRRTFKFGLSLRVLDTAQQIVEKNKLTGKALMVIDQQKAEAEEALGNMGGRQRARRSKDLRSGHIAGFVAGENVKLNERTK